MTRRPCRFGVTSWSSTNRLVVVVALYHSRSMLVQFDFVLGDGIPVVPVVSVLPPLFPTDVSAVR